MIQNTLQQAIWNSNFEEIETILNSNPNEFDTIQKHNLEQFYSNLIKNNKFSIIQLLINNKKIETDLYEYEKYSGTIFASLFKNLNNDEESIAFLSSFITNLDNNNESVENKTLLHLAIESLAKPIIIKELINSGCNINYKDNYENTFLHAILTNYNIKGELLKKYAQILIDEGIDVNSVNKGHESVLFTAVKNNKIDAIELLLDNGADANHQNTKGESVFYECIVNKRTYDVLVILCNYQSIDFLKVTSNNENILYHFLRNCSEREENIFDILLEQNADFNQETVYYSVTTSKSLLYKIPYSFFEKAIESGSIDIHETDNDGNSILHTICEKDLNHDQNLAKLVYKKVKFLVEKGINVSLTNNNGKTAMDLALTDNLKDKIVTLLINSKQ